MEVQYESTFESTKVLSYESTKVPSYESTQRTFESTKVRKYESTFVRKYFRTKEIKYLYGSRQIPSDYDRIQYSTVLWKSNVCARFALAACTALQIPRVSTSFRVSCLFVCLQLIEGAVAHRRRARSSARGRDAAVDARRRADARATRALARDARVPRWRSSLSKHERRQKIPAPQRRGVRIRASVRIRWWRRATARDGGRRANPPGRNPRRCSWTAPAVRSCRSRPRTSRTIASSPRRCARRAATRTNRART